MNRNDKEVFFCNEETEKLINTYKRNAFIRVETAIAMAESERHNQDIAGILKERGVNLDEINQKIKKTENYLISEFSVGLYQDDSQNAVNRVKEKLGVSLQL
jgi:hypothetical protein